MRVGTKICVKILLVEKINKNITNIGFVQFQVVDHLLLGEEGGFESTLILGPNLQKASSIAGKGTIMS